MVPSPPQNSHPSQHLDLLSRFSTAHGREHTDDRSRYICSYRPRLMACIATRLNSIKMHTYKVGQETAHQTHGHNSVKSERIFKILLL